LNDAGVKVYAYLDDKEITVEGFGKVEGFLKGWQAEEERGKGSQRCRDASRLLVQQGKPTGGRCFGYTTRGGAIVPAALEAW